MGDTNTRYTRDRRQHRASSRAPQRPHRRLGAARPRRRRPGDGQRRARLRPGRRHQRLRGRRQGPLPRQHAGRPDARRRTTTSTPTFLDADGQDALRPLPDRGRVLLDAEPAPSSSSDQFGGPHGDYFNDVDDVPAGAQATAVSLRGGSRVDQVGVTLSDGTTLTHGGTGGTAASLTLGSGEYVTSAPTSRRSQQRRRTRIFYARLRRTSAGRWPAAPRRRTASPAPHRPAGRSPASTAGPGTRSTRWP